jgi:hypothetical protein
MIPTTAARANSVRRRLARNQRTTESGVGKLRLNVELRGMGVVPVLTGK